MYFKEVAQLKISTEKLLKTRTQLRLSSRGKDERTDQALGPVQATLGCHHKRLGAVSTQQGVFKALPKISQMSLCTREWTPKGHCQGHTQCSTEAKWPVLNLQAEQKG